MLVSRVLLKTILMLTNMFVEWLFQNCTRIKQTMIKINSANNHLLSQRYWNFVPKLPLKYSSNKSNKLYFHIENIDECLLKFQ